MTILEQELNCQILLETWGLYTVKTQAGFILNACLLPGSTDKLSSVLLCVRATELVDELPADYPLRITGPASTNLALSFLHYGWADRIERLHLARFGAAVSEDVVDVWDKSAAPSDPEDDDLRRKRRLFRMASGDVICGDVTRFFDYENAC